MVQKRKLRVLMLSPFIHPEPISTGKYNTYLAKALAGQSLSVEVIAYHPFYPEWKPKRTKATLENVKIYRGGGFLPYPRSMVLRRMQLELGFIYHTIRHIILNRKKDIVISIFPPMLFFPFVRFILPYNTKKIGIVHDIQGVMANVSNSFSRKILIKFIRLFEGKILNSCDRLIFLSNSMANRAIMDYDLRPEKITVTYPFITLETGNPSNKIGHLFPKGYKHIVYSGAIGEKQNPFELLKFFQAVVNNRADIICHFFSRGPLLDELTEANTETFDRVLFHDLVTEENLNELYMRSDVQIIPQKEGTSDGAIPSKLPNIISAGVPILSICDPESELSKIVRESGIGYSADSWNIKKLVVALSNLIQISAKKTHQERRKIVKGFVEKNFSINKLLQTILA